MRAAATLLTACAIAWLGVTSSAAVKVRTQFTKSFDFAKAKTWSWHEGGAGEVKMARTADDDPEVVRQRAEPVIMEAVAGGAAAARPDRRCAGRGHPISRSSTTSSSPSGRSRSRLDSSCRRSRRGDLPPFTGATQSYKVIEQGSLVLDISANKEVVWRGIGQAELKPGQTPEKRSRSSRKRCGRS